MNLTHLADCAGPHIFDGRSRLVKRVALVAHLGDDFCLFCLLRELARLVDRGGEWLLDVNVFAEIHRRERDRRVHMVWCCDDDAVDVLLAIEHLAIVLIALGLRQMLVLQPHQVFELRCRFRAIEFDRRLARSRRRRPLLDARPQVRDVGVEPLEPLAGIAPVDVAEGDDILACQVDQVAAAHAADADSGDVQRIAGRRESPAEHVPRDDGECGAPCRHFREKRSPRQPIAFFTHGFSYNCTAGAAPPAPLI